ncbi:MAG: hypothetical protein II944_04800 [Ruminobacter sp.]|nr:hypothetical protein [Ruminobacter sp.]
MLNTILRMLLRSNTRGYGRRRSPVSIVLCLIIAAVLYIFGGGHKQHTGNEGPYQYQQQQQQQYGTDHRHAVYKFRNKRLLDEHFEKHGRNMGFASADDYQLAAVLVLNNPKSLHKYEKDDGDDVYYLESSNEIVIVSRDGYIRTYFKPNNGIRYYNSK